jgi:hypothetical protein
MNKDIKEVALLGQYEDNNILYPAAQILNKDQNVAFDPVFVARSMVSLYEAFLSHVPENRQIEFEQKFKDALASMLNCEERYTFKLNDHDNQ